MGQRHQVYVRLPKKFIKKNNPNNKDEVVIGIHHQWLYGRRAVSQLIIFSTFCLVADEDNIFANHYGSPVELLSALYSLDITDGYFSSVVPLVQVELDDPLNGDNNNGITIIDLADFTEDKIKDGTFVLKYCFMSLHHLECLDKELSTEWNRDPVNHLRPLSAEEYLRLHYPSEVVACDRECDCHNNKDLQIEHQKANIKNEAECKKLIQFFTKNKKKVQLLTGQEVKKIFPKGLCKRK